MPQPILTTQSIVQRTITHPTIHAQYTALALCLLLLLLGPAAVLAFSSFPLPSTTTPQQCPSPSSTPTALSAASTSPDSSSSTSRISSRREWLTQSLLLPSLGAASLGLFGQMGAANAAADPAKAGTKDDPAYQVCWG